MESSPCQYMSGGKKALLFHTTLVKGCFVIIGVPILRISLPWPISLHQYSSVLLFRSCSVIFDDFCFCLVNN